MMNISHVSLVGFMGAGKSTVGRYLSKILSYHFIDLDSWIENSEGTSINKIFKIYGEGYFRKLEQNALAIILNTDQPAVIALGGGSFCNPISQDLLQKKSTTIYLEANFQTLHARLLAPKEQINRPLLQNQNQLEILFLEREPAYKKSVVHILTEGKLPNIIAMEIAQQIAEKNNQ